MIMEDLPLVDFSKVRKKRPAQKQNIINKFTESSELDDFVIDKVPKKREADEKQSEHLAKESLIDSLQMDGTNEYPYEFLLDRITNLIKKHNPSMTDSVRGPLKIPVPIINKVGTSRSAWTNFAEVCSVLNRPTEHLYQFILAELGVEGSLGGESQFLLKGKYNNKHIESVLKKYVHDYLQCATCKSSSTVFKKDNSARLQVLSCNACGSERSVAPIKTAVSRSQKK
jgi:translation initiation factor 2 subunit 2